MNTQNHFLRNRTLSWLGCRPLFRTRDSAVSRALNIRAGVIVLSALAILLCATTPAWAATYNWNNASGGNWNTAANWTPNVVPTSSDTANITLAGTYTVTLNVSTNVQSLILGGASSGVQTVAGSGFNLVATNASINGGGVLSLTNSTFTGSLGIANGAVLTVNGVTMAAQVTVESGGELLAVGAASDSGQPGNANNANDWLWVQSGGVVNAGAVLEVSDFVTNSGVINLTNKFYLWNDETIQYEGDLYNLSGGVIDLWNNGGISLLSADGNLVNQGTVNMSSGTSSTVNALNVTNTGIIATLSGTGTLDIGQFSGLGSLGGTFNAASGTIIQLEASTSPGTSPGAGLNLEVEGTGQIEFNSGLLTLPTALIPNLELTGGTLALGSGFQGGAITALTLDGSSLSTTLPVTGTLVMTNGTLSGSIVVENGAVLTVNGVTMAAQVTVESGGELLAVGAASDSGQPGNANNANDWLWVQSGGVVNAGAVLEVSDFVTNSGVINLTNKFYLWNDETIQYEGDLYNLSGGVIDLWNNGGISLLSADGNLVNQGTVNMSSGTSSTVNALNVTNTGIIATLSGTGTLDIGQFSGLGSLGGTFNAASGTIIQLEASTSPGTSPGAGLNLEVEGTGQIEFNSGLLTLPTALIPNLELTGGTLALGSGFQGGAITALTLDGSSLSTTLPVTGTLVMTNGTLSGSIVVENGAVLTVNGVTMAAQVTVESGGELLAVGAASDSGQPGNANNANDWLWVQSGGVVNAGAVLEVSDFVTNSGVINLTNKFYLWNDETIQYEGDLYNLSGGVIDLWNNGGISLLSADGNLVNQGTVNMSSGTSSTVNALNVTNTGIIATLSGTGTLDIGQFSGLGSLGGTFNAASGTIIQLEASTSPGTSPGAGLNLEVEGTGQIEFNSGLLTLPTALIPNLELTGGTLALGSGFQGGAITALTLDGSSLSTTLPVTGTLVMTNGTLSGSIVVENGAVLTVNGVTMAAQVTVESGGELLAVGAASDSGQPGNANNANDWLWVQSGGVVNEGAALEVSDFVTNSGVINVTNTFYLWNDGAIQYEGDLYNLSGGVIDLWNNGGIGLLSTDGNLVNQGTISVFSPGGTSVIDVFNLTNEATLSAQQGTLAVDSAHLFLQSSSVLNVGLNSSNNYGKITLPAGVDLNGAISANLNDGFLPAIGDVFNVLSYPSFTGTFNNTNLPSTETWNTSYSAPNLRLTVTGIGAPPSATITWANPANIVYPTPLGGAQLDATANTPGTFVYAPPSGTVLNPGNGQTLTVVFTPNNLALFSPATNTASINVLPLPVILTGTRAYDGTTAAASTILKVANVVGSDVVTVASGSATLASATAGVEVITSVGTLALGGSSAAKYTLVGASGSVTVTATSAVITTAPTASAITYGQALSASVLSGGVASVPGTFAFTTPSTKPGVGTASQGVTFTPTDTTDYSSVSTTVSVTVNKAAPTITTAPTASAITYGQALSASVLSGGVGSVAGTFAFTTPSTKPGAGTASQSVTFTPSDTVDYTTVSTTVSVTVNKATPTITTSPTASAITYAQALSASVLSGGVGSVAGTFAFTTPATMPSAGTASQSVTFTPTDTTDYSSVSTTVSVTVNKATPTITTSPTASAITYGQALSASVLSGGVGSVAGTFAFTTPATVPGAGTASHSVTFTPSDTVDYNTVSTTVSVTVNKATPTIATSPTASAITYGQALSASVLSGGVGSVGGTFAFTTPATMPSAGTASQGVTFTPTDTTDYNTVSTTVSVTVNKATPSITTAPTASAITFGQALSASALSGGVGSVAGTFAFTTPSTVPGAGTALQSVTFTPSDTTDYNTVSTTISVLVNKATPSITTAPTASAIIFGQSLSASSLSGGVGSVAGTFAFTTPSTMPSAGTASQSVTFTPSDAVDYNTVSTTVSVLVNKATPTITTAPTASAITLGQALSASVLSGGMGSVAGSFAFTTPSTTPGAGTALQGVTFTPSDTADYNTVSITVSVTVNNKATPSITIAPTASAITYGQALSASVLSGGVASVAGTFAFTTPSTVPGAGTASQSVTFTPSDTADYNTVSTTVSVTVNKATPSITTAPTASAITYGQALSASALSGGVGSVAGSFAFTTPSTKPGAGTASQSVTFTPSDTVDYTTVSTTVSVLVNPLPVILTGTRTYDATTNAASTILSVSNIVGSDDVIVASGRGGLASAEMGTNAITSVGTLALGGTAAANYTLTGASGAVVVTPLPVVLTGTRPYDGTATALASILTISNNLDGANLTLTGSATLAGASVALQDITDFTGLALGGTAATNYTLIGASGSVMVNKATPTITTSPTASAITYGQALSASVLSGGVGSVAGTFAFTTPATVPGAGTASHSVTFTPSDTVDYNTVSTTVSVTVNKATPSITAAPTTSAITYGQALSASILSGGVASVAGTFAFTTPSTAPGAGTAPQSVTFTPTDTTDYNTVSTTVSVLVNKATPTITTAPTASAITLGQALSASVLSGGMGSVAGSFAFTTPSTTPGAGTALQGVTFTPSDTADYNTVSITVSVTVNNKATPSITIAPTASAITYGQALSASVLSGGVASVAGTFAFTTPSTVPGAGTASQSVTFTPSDTADYNTVSTTVSVTVNKATPSITTAPTASAITYGQALSASALSGGVGSVAGSFAFTTPSTMPGVGTASQGVTFTPIDATDYKAVSTTVSVLVNPLPVILTGTRTYDATTNAASTILSVSNIVGSDDVIVASGRGGLASAEMGTNAITSVRTLALGGTAAGNYTLIGASGAVEVTPLPVVLTGTRPYDGTATALASILTISNDLDGANLTLTGSATLAGASVALQDITDFTGLALGGTAATNYTLIGASGSVTITASEVTITCPQDITVNKATGECSQIVAFAPIATGNPAPTVVCVWNGNSITSPFSFPVGTNVVTCTASNLSGMESCNFKVTVVDTNPPVAGPNSLGTYENQTTSVAVAKMLLRDSAPSGGPLSIPSVVPTTANGASVSLGRGLITYVPPANFIGLDFITYTLSDGCGTAPGTINVLVLATNLPAKNEVSITHSASGTTVVFAGVPGASYVVQSAPAVTGPWTNLSNPLEAAANGLIQYTDTTSPPPATRFYRTQFVSGP